ncbi:MAG: glutathione S-transferase family protein [Proteobacteria bacterium]|nr:glutathione S-transferase family protein [Pseudomonadota bacterium]
MAPDITLYASVYSRSFTARWMLAELGLPHRVVDVDIRKGRHKSPDYLRINPMGKVPALTDGGVTVTENPAICLYLADRYGLGTLAPTTDDPLRGPYLRWCVFATAVFEPAVYLQGQPDDDVAVSGRGWGRRETVLEIIDDLLAPGPWILGERFSTADVVLGSQISVALFNKRIAETPALAAYDARIAARPAYRAAAAANWPPPVAP